MVTPTTASGPPAAARNWNRVPTGIDRQIPGSSGTVSSRAAWRRHICPRPLSTYQISSTLWCTTAREVRPAASSKCAIEPPSSRSRTRTSEPSGATASRSPGSRIVSNGWVTAITVVPACPGPARLERFRRKAQRRKSAAAEERSGGRAQRRKSAAAEERSGGRAQRRKSAAAEERGGGRARRREGAAAGGRGGGRPRRREGGCDPPAVRVRGDGNEGRRKHMTRIVLTEFISLDGVMEEPRWTFGFERAPKAASSSSTS